MSKDEKIDIKTKKKQTKKIVLIIFTKIFGLIDTERQVENIIALGCLSWKLKELQRFFSKTFVFPWKEIFSKT